MGFLKIYCDSCGGTWDVYHRDIHSDNARKCPHCLAKIDGQTWNRQILPAFGEMLDTERELFKDHMNRAPLFCIDFVADGLYLNARNRDRTADTLADAVADCTTDEICQALQGIAAVRETMPKDSAPERMLSEIMTAVFKNADHERTVD